MLFGHTFCYQCLFSPNVASRRYKLLEEKTIIVRRCWGEGGLREIQNLSIASLIKHVQCIAQNTSLMFSFVPKILKTWKFCSFRKNFFVQIRKFASFPNKFCGLQPECGCLLLLQGLYGNFVGVIQCILSSLAGKY